MGITGIEPPMMNDMIENIFNCEDTNILFDCPPQFLGICI